jgi:leucyl aminopeptidase
VLYSAGMKFKPLVAALAACLASAGALAAPTWITLADDALQVLKRMTPSIEVLGTAEVSVTVPESARSPALRTRTERVHAVQIEDTWLEILSVMVHGELQRCGGYVHHDSMAAALATLHRLEVGPQAVGPAPSYAIDDIAKVQLMMPQLQASNVLATIDAMTQFQNRRYNSSHGVAASNWLFNLWSGLKPAERRDVRVTQITHNGGYPQKSVSFEIIGSITPNEVVILGGHLDSIAGSAIETSRAPGADDNASGIAGLTEIIRVLMASDYAPRRTLRFIAYAAEEVGLRGSNEIAAAYLSSPDLVVGKLQLDMTAYKSPLDNKEIWLYTDYTNAAQNAFLASLVAFYLPDYTVGYSACGYGCSDHAAWHNRGFIASFPHEASNANYNRQIHTVNDTIATFGGNADHAIKFTQLALAYAVELGGGRFISREPRELVPVKRPGPR